MSLLFWITSSVLAQEYVGVLDVEGNVSQDIKTQLADETRSGALHALPSTQYTILTRENMLSIIQDQNKSNTCFEGSCEVEIGRNIGADLIISGQIVLIEGIYLYSLKLHDTQSGALLATERIEGDSALSLIRKTASITETFLEEALHISPAPTNTYLEQTKFSVQFNSTPRGAEVWIDNTQVCSTTPCSVAIPQGFHNVEFKKDLYQIWKADFQAKNGLEIRAQLSDVNTKLHLESKTSGIKIYLDDVFIGTTPLDAQNISPGPHVLRYEGTCSGSQEERFVAKEGVDLFRELSSEAFSSPLHVAAINQDGKPIRGRVYLDGQFAGYTPFSESISSCTNRVEIEAEIDGIVQRRSLPLSLQENKEEYITLEFFSATPPRKKKRRHKKTQ